MKLRPLNDGVIAKRVESETKTAGGIIIPDTAKEKPVEAEVVAVGPGKLLDDGKHKKMQVKVGDRIVFKRFNSNEVIKFSGEEYLILNEAEILAVYEN